MWSLYKELQNLRKVDIHADGTEILSKEQMLQRREKAEAGGRGRVHLWRLVIHGKGVGKQTQFN